MEWNFIFYQLTTLIILLYVNASVRVLFLNPVNSGRTSGWSFIGSWKKHNLMNHMKVKNQSPTAEKLNLVIRNNKAIKSK
jgi:hypothetical protein